MAKDANGAVVSIVMSDKEGRVIVQGTGFLASKDGRIVTNYHVIAEGSSAVAKLPDGAFFVVDGVLAFDKARDIAVIKAHGENFRTVALGDSGRIQVGEEVVAIGNPLSLESTVSNGIVSSVRTINEAGGKYLQITAPISPGSSGGPLFNMAGEVVGITTMYLKGGENLNFAIPINDAKRLILVRSSRVLALPNEPEAVGPQEHDVDAQRGAALLQQKTCADQAKQLFDDYKKNPLVEIAGYTSHYDATASRCSIEISNHNVYEGREITHNRFIKDAFEGRNYGAFVSGSTNDLKHRPSVCTIEPPSRPEIVCRSEQEFDDLALKYFGTTPQ